jgi:DNA-binding transcriptional regulator YiaG
MSGFTAAFNSEIKRVARKELKGEIAAVRSKANAGQHEIAALKKRLKELETLVTKLARAQIKSAPDQASTMIATKQTRWSAAGFARLRQRLQISAKEMSRLMGVSMATIYHWEDADSAVRPRTVHMPRILAARKLSAAKARKILDAM